MISKLLLAAFCFLSLNAFSQPTTNGSAGATKGSLPACSGANPQNWDNCTGTFTYPNGNIYTGEYHQGHRQGKGKIRILAKGQSTDRSIASDIPSTYVGEFSGDRLNGYGVWTTDKGEKFVGYFVNNIYYGKNPPAQQAPVQAQPSYLQPVQQAPQPPQRSAQQQQMCDNLAQKIKENDPNQNAWLALQNGLQAANASAGNYGNGGVAMANQNKIQQEQLLMQMHDQYMRYCQ